MQVKLIVLAVRSACKQIGQEWLAAQAAKPYVEVAPGISGK